MSSRPLLKKKIQFMTVIVSVCIYKLFSALTVTKNVINYLCNKTFSLLSDVQNAV
jgi:hypothetical protein